MKKYSVPGFFLLFLLLFSACMRISPNASVSKSDVCLDTVISITLYGTTDEALLDQCFSLCQNYEQLFSRTLPGSDIYRINHANGMPTAVSSETAELLKLAVSYSELSEGAFDCSIAPLSILWDFKNNTGSIPDVSSIRNARSLVDYRTIELQGTTVTLKNKKASLDLGGIAKGYIADRLKEYLLEKGIKSALLNLGGNVLTIGAKPDGSEWNIGIQRPFESENSAVASLKVTDRSVVTSGVYERFFIKDETLYHHILNPFTGYPADNGLYSVTIISEHSVDADALSTACFVLGMEKGMKFIKSIPDVEAVFLTSENQLVYSKGRLPAKGSAVQSP